MSLPRLLLLTDATQLPAGRALLDTVAECAAAGLEAVVVREHRMPRAERAELVAGLVRLTGLTVISSRLPEPAAHGLQLAGFQPAPRRGWWGRSCHSPSDVATAAAQGATYVTLSPYSATASKRGYGPPLDPAAYAGHTVPVYALGGIGPGNAAAARRLGSHGVAVMGAVMRSSDPAGVVGDLLRELR